MGMGIAHLKRHMQPHASSVWIGSTQDTPNDDARRITSVVIDGPSLVYHVYHCLLSRMEPQFNAVDARPSSDEVSVGTMRFLLHLRALNVTVRQICFDGTLPLVKRPTRLERLENSRSKLERLCRTSPNGFSKLSIRQDAVKIDDARMVFGRRHSAVTAREAPVDPFMVATVIEDLKNRWTWDRISGHAPGVDSASERAPDDRPWADVTSVEPGEADVYAAEAARLTNSSVLTGDSDLLVHDLGLNGSAIFLDSLQSMQLHDRHSLFPVRAEELSPAVVSKKFGITNLKRLGFELKYSPSTSISTLVQRCKDYPSDEAPSDLYLSFLKEYEAPDVRHSALIIDGVILDPRIAELCLQYEISELREGSDPPHIYLPFLMEDCARRCAWAEGSWIRALAYSLLDRAFPGTNSSQSVMEYTRRGDRVCPTTAELLEREEDIDACVESLLRRLNSSVPHASMALIYWKTLALSEIWHPSNANNNPSLDRGDIRQFLEEGYTGSRLSWNDIHLGAQVQAVLYSLKTLKDLATAALPGPYEGNTKALCIQLVENLSTLPPLRVLSDSRYSRQSENIPDGSIDSAVRKLSSQQRHGDADEDEQGRQSMSFSSDPEGQVGEEEFRTVQSRGGRRMLSKPTEPTRQPVPNKSANVYEMLGEAN